MFIVGLTGGIASGKSTAARLFNQLGITIVDADIIARQVVEPDQPALAEIARHFGATILQTDSSLNRSRLREIIFTDHDAKQWLENLLHPLIYEKALATLHAAQGDYVIYMSPLIFESQQRSWCNRLLVVDLPEALQIQRGCLRDQCDADNIRRIMATQITRNDRLAAADDIIDNSGTPEQLQSQVSRLHQQFIALAQSAKS